MNTLPLTSDIGPDANDPPVAMDARTVELRLMILAAIANG